MDEAAVKRLAMVLGVQAEVEGMKVANEVKRNNKETLAYSEEEFIKVAIRLTTLAAMHRDQF